MKRTHSLNITPLKSGLLGLVSASLLALGACQVQTGTTETKNVSQTTMTSAIDYSKRATEDEVVYFMLPDRFENGDPSNDTGGMAGDKFTHGFDPTHKGFYHGGDLKGLTSKLDYIQGLGATAIWLGPIYKNKPVQGAEPWISAGYHGYWITDFTTVDPHLGTEADLKDFVDSAHARGMKVYLDIITNHTADVIAMRECHDPDYNGEDKVDGPCAYRSRADYPFTTRGNVNGAPINDGFSGVEEHLQTPENFARLTRPDYAYTPYIAEAETNVKVPAWLNDPIYYHNRGESHWVGQSAIQGDFSGLDDLMTEHPVVINGMIDIFKDWITEYKVDGFRVDTAKHVNPEFWHAFVPAMMNHAKSQGIEDFYIFGEAYYDREPEMLAWQTRKGGYDNVLDFAVSDAIIDISTGKSPHDSFNKLFKMDDMYVKGQGTAMRNPTFIGNHDKGRLSGMIKAAAPDISQTELLERVRIAHELLIFLRGVPVIYSGDEQGFVSDGHDQSAREDMFPSQTAVYNDNDLIGTDATTAEANFDTQHPLYQSIKKATDIRKSHLAFRRGITVPRLMEENGSVLAFSRFDPENGHEYLVAGNFGDSVRDVNVPIDAASQSFDSLLGNCPAETSATGVVQLELHPFELIVCRADRPAGRQGK